MNRICRVKICGIKSIENALCAVYNGVHALGFVFYDKSPRFVEINQAKKIIMELPAFVNKVGVFVNHSLDEILKIVNETGIDTIQLHGEKHFYNLDFLKELRSKSLLPVIYAIRLERISDEIFSDRFLLDISSIASNILIDKFSSKLYGGTGETILFDEEKPLTETSKEFISRKVIIAGGINSRNVKEIITRYNPYGIDVSSGVEIEKGKKDNSLIAEFMTTFYSYLDSLC